MQVNHKLTILVLLIAGDDFSRNGIEQHSHHRWRLRIVVLEDESRRLHLLYPVYLWLVRLAYQVLLGKVFAYVDYFHQFAATHFVHWYSEELAHLDLTAIVSTSIPQSACHHIF